MSKVPVTFMPMNIVCQGDEGESLLDVALNHDVPLQHACGGFCSCTTCHLHVTEGIAGLTAMDDDENERINTTADNITAQSRLGCQARIKTGVQGSIVVQVMNVE